MRFVGQATSASQFFRQTGATVGAALMGTVLATSLGIAFGSLDLPRPILEDPEASIERMVSTGGSGIPDRIRASYATLAAAAAEPEAEALRAEGEAAAETVAGQIREAFTLATARIYWLTAFLVGIALVLCLRIPEIPLRTTHDRAEAVAPPPDEG